MRYDKQVNVPVFGNSGQKRLSTTTIAILGCGGLGCLLAEWLTRMGVGALRIADNDHVTADNLHRQVLFTEKDAARGQLKVEVAATRLPLLNSNVRLTTFTEQITAHNIAEFVGNANLVLDATDNILTRFLLNDYCIAHAIPWIYAGVAGTEGVVLPVIPPDGPCLRCLFPEPPVLQQESRDCIQNGVLPPVIALTTALQITQALRIITGSAKPGILLRTDVWQPRLQISTLSCNPACVCCAARQFEFLNCTSEQGHDSVTPCPS